MFELFLSGVINGKNQCVPVLLNRTPVPEQSSKFTEHTTHTIII